MRTLALLLGKDFRRTWRNPWPWLMNLGLPIAITAVIGMVFGGAGRGGSGDVKIKFAVVDEDRSIIGGMLRSMATQGEGAERMDPVYMNRAEALGLLRENKLSAILIVPTNFTTLFLDGATNLSLEVIKNPAQSFSPAIVEEMAGVAVAGLNAVARNFTADFGRLRKATENNWDFDVVEDSVRKLGTRLQAARKHLDPPLISVGKELKEKEQPAAGGARTVIMDVFGFILPGMASAFLLFMADQSMRDFHREIRMKTFARQRTVGASAGVYIASKIVFTALTVMIASAILFAGGSLIFGIDWGRPGLLALACAGYSLFAAGLLAALVALSNNERRTEVMNSMLIFVMAFAGGSYLPSRNFPDFMRENITTLMPNHWLIETARALQNNGDDFMGPLTVVLKLALVGVALGMVAAFFINRRLRV